VEDWAAVAEAINVRVNELGWRQGELAERSHVSRATVRELQHHVVERRRSARTLEALSITLGWHPHHIDAVLHGRRPPGRLNRSRTMGRLCPRGWTVSSGI
jgi:plasmid maintenance system antidote protein VapI